jgi:multiple sugar transport system substrate-binding protein
VKLRLEKEAKNHKFRVIEQRMNKIAEFQILTYLGKGECNMNKRSIFNWIVLVAMLGATLTGCSPAAATQAPAAPPAAPAATLPPAALAPGPATEAPTAVQAPAATQAPAVQPTAAPVAATPDTRSATLTIWTGYPELEPFYRDVAAQFQKTHPNVQFQFLSTTLREFEAKLQTALPSCSGPDIFDVEPNLAPILVAGNLIDPNPPAVDAQVKSGAYTPYVVNYFTYSGKTYGIPMMDGSLAALYYNKDMFTAAGLDPNKPPTTFDEMMTDAIKLTKTDATGKITVSGMSMRLSGQGSGIAEKFWFFLHNMGGDIIVPSADGKGWHNGYDNAAGQKALTYYIDSVYKNKVTSPTVPSDAAAFEAGQAAMLLRESWVIGDIAKNSPNLNYGVAPMPRDVKFDTLTQPAGIYVAKCSKNPDLAWEYNQLLTNKTNPLLQVKETGWVSDRSDVDMSALVAQIPQYSQFVNPPKDMGYYAYPLIPSFDEVETKMADRLTAAYLVKSLVDNPTGIASTIHAMAVETDSILKANGAYATP